MSWVNSACRRLHRVAVAAARRSRALFIGQAHALLFLCGFGWFYVGVAHFSIGMANGLAGLLLMAIAAWPFLRMRKP